LTEYTKLKKQEGGLIRTLIIGIPKDDFSKQAKKLLVASSRAMSKAEEASL
jgi:hypothetical protein